MEQSEDQPIRLQVCQKCYEHQQYDVHSQQQYHWAFENLSAKLKQIGMTVIRNQPPKYLRKVADTKHSSKRYMDTNTGKILEFPTRGSFNVYYRNVLVYSKLFDAFFPDLDYLVTILNQLRQLTTFNPIVLSSLDRFRDLQYQWKKNSHLSESLYSYIKLNACGNISAQVVKQILSRFIESYKRSQQKKIQGNIANRKIIHPYILYDNQEKKYKLQSIYCPKNAVADYLTQRINEFNSKNFKKDGIRPKTGTLSYRHGGEHPGCNIKIGSDMSSSNNQRNVTNRPNQIDLKDNTQNEYRKPGVIINNMSKQRKYYSSKHKNHIFELVIKQQNKKLNQQKYKRFMKQQKLQISQVQNFAYFKHHNSKSISNPKSIPDLKSFCANINQPLKLNQIKDFGIVRKNKCTKTNRESKFQGQDTNKIQIKSKQVYFAHLDNLKNRQKNKIDINKINIKVQKAKNTNKKSNQNRIRNSDLKINSNRSKTLQKNVPDQSKRKQSENANFRLNLNSNRSNRSNRSNKNVSRLKSCNNNSSSRYGSIKKNGLSQGQQYLQDKIKNHSRLSNGGANTQRKTKDEMVDNESGLSKRSKKNSKCIKQSIYSRVRKSAQDSRLIKKDQKQLLINENLQNPQGRINDNQNQSVSQSSSCIRRASIQEVTVQKRISQRKRSSNHQRYPNRQSLCKLNTLQKQIAQCEGKDQIQMSFQSSIQEQKDENVIKEEWNCFISTYIHMRQPALIIKRFAEDQNFVNINSYSTKYEHLMREPYSKQVQFNVKGQDLCKKFVMKSIRQICKPSQIKLFPLIFKQIQHQNVSHAPPTTIVPPHIQKAAVPSIPSISPDSKNFTANTVYNFFQSKLIHVANLMLRSNPMMITRIFQDKKSINPYGVYCIWLRSLQGRYEPVFVNDYFPFQQITQSFQQQKAQQNQGSIQNCRKQINRIGPKTKNLKKLYKPTYSWLSNQNSIWYMLLQKAVAKVLNGYHVLNEISLAQLIGMIMGSPAVDIGYINPQKALKVFDQKIFYNKMASLYTLRQCLSEGICAGTNVKDMQRIDRIIGFSYNKRDPKQSAVNIKIQEATITVLMRDFLLNYGQIALLFFNPNYFLNQIQLQTTITDQQVDNDISRFGTTPSVLSCHLTSFSSKNNCYLMFSNFPEKYQTKVTLYRQLDDHQANIIQGMNPLAEENKKYQYVGEITKSGNFFFEVQINSGQFICLMESIFCNENSMDMPEACSYQSKKPFLSILSQSIIKIGSINCHFTHNNKKQGNKSNKTSRVRQKTRNKNHVKIDQEQRYNQSPKVLIQHKIPANKPKFYQQRALRKQQNNNRLNISQQSSWIKLNKVYAYEPDNLLQEQQEQNKENKGIKGKNKQKHIKNGPKEFFEQNHHQQNVTMKNLQVTNNIHKTSPQNIVFYKKQRQNNQTNNNNENGSYRRNYLQKNKIIDNYD